jgi:hypothetical protein
MLNWLIAGFFVVTALFFAFGVLSPLIDGAAKAIGQILGRQPGRRSAGYGAGAGLMLLAIGAGAVILALS